MLNSAIQARSYDNTTSIAFKNDVDDRYAAGAVRRIPPVDPVPNIAVQDGSRRPRAARAGLLSELASDAPTCTGVARRSPSRTLDTRRPEPFHARPVS